MVVTRRDFIRASSALAAALAVKNLAFRDEDAWGAEGAPQVVWLQAQSCTGCSVSLMNSIRYGGVDALLTKTIDLQYHSTLMAAAGDSAVAAAEASRARGGYILVVEGSIPTGTMERTCYLWPGRTALSGVRAYAARARFILAVGTCATHGGIVAGTPNPTAARGVRTAVGSTQVPIINLPGCPAHPDWIIDVVSYLIRHGHAPTLDSYKWPTAIYGTRVHDRCTWRSSYVGPNHHSGGRACTRCHDDDGDDDEEGIGDHVIAEYLSQPGCMFSLGCKGPLTRADCPTRQWNAPAVNTYGINWCVASRVPCQGCTEPNFPDAMSPFFTLEKPLAPVPPGGGEEGDDDDDD